MASCQSPANLRLLYRQVIDLEYGLPGAADYYRDEETGLVVQYPVPTVCDVEALYPTGYRPHSTSGVVHRLKQFQARFLFKAIKADLPARDGSILEIGPGGGHLLLTMSRRGYKKLAGMDVKSSFRSYFEENDIHFIAGNIETDDVISSRYDCIVMVNVIEHLVDPASTLRRLRMNLAPGGKMLLITPNEDSLSHKVFGRYWSGLHAPRHIFVFNPATIARFAGKLGFRSRMRLLHDVTGWAISVQNVIRSLGRISANDGATSWYTILALPFMLPMSLFEHLIGRSSSMLVVLDESTDMFAAKTL